MAPHGTCCPAIFCSDVSTFSSHSSKPREPARATTSPNPTEIQMPTRRDIMKTTLAAGAAAVFAPAEFGHAADAKLSWQHFPAGPNGFFRAPVLLSGPTEVVLIDGGFN